MQRDHEVPNPRLAELVRSGRVESWHRGSLAVWHDDRLVLGTGSVHDPVYCRSAVKPLQALPLFERGLVDRFGWGPAEIAVLVASHDGTAAHVAAVRSLLQKAGMDEERLGCGAHPPFDSATRNELVRAGVRPLRVHSNCSGKHSGFLCLARECGDDLAHYLDPHNRSQSEVQAAVAAMAGVPGPVPVGVDGCGAPTFWLPLTALARAFARLANPFDQPPVRRAACARILDAVAAEPVLVAGEKRFCTTLLRNQPCTMFAKNGAEGVYALALGPDPERSRFPGALGIAVKVDDGAERGYQPVLADLLQHLYPHRTDLHAALAPWRVQLQRNTRDELVGEVRCAPGLDWARLLA